ncbi:MAG: aspartate-semialdehyde dehydrogenase [Nitrososphaerota archaeon]
MKQIRVAVLGATGMVGQRYVSMLSRHPWFKLSCLTGKESIGKKYGEAVRGNPVDIPSSVADMEVLPTEPKYVDADLVFSPLPTEAAHESEPLFAKEGFNVVSDASAHRMEKDVPLIVPEINPGHIELIDVQRRNRKWDGYIVTTPNCTTIGLVMPLKPLHDAYVLKKVVVTTMQAVSGAGFPGVPSLSILGNVIPYISGEEGKVEKETLKILGRFKDGLIEPAHITIEASCTRVPTIDGHLESVYVETEKAVGVDGVKKTLAEFKGLPQELNLPTAPERPIIVMEEEDRPQPRLDIYAGSVPGMSAVVGRIRSAKDEKALKLFVLSHNTVRGAAGIAILTAELLHATGRID